jgi:hypothetical protein
MTDRAEVSAVVHGHHTDADVPGLLDGQAHRLRSHDDAEPPPGIDHRCAGRLTDDAPAGLGIQLARLVIPDVRAQHVRHAMRLDAAEVRHRQHVRAFRGIVRANPQLLEDLRHRLSQCRFRNPDLVFLGNLEALENHGSFLA